MEPWGEATVSVSVFRGERKGLWSFPMAFPGEADSSQGWGVWGQPAALALPGVGAIRPLQMLPLAQMVDSRRKQEP